MRGMPFPAGILPHHRQPLPLFHRSRGTPSFLSALTSSYKATQTTRIGAIGEATGTRFDRDALVGQATERRLWLKIAADAEWPHTDPANTPIRREFQLPANRPFIG